MSNLKEHIPIFCLKKANASMISSHWVFITSEEQIKNEQKNKLHNAYYFYTHTTGVSWTLNKSHQVDFNRTAAPFQHTHSAPLVHFPTCLNMDSIQSSSSKPSFLGVRKLLFELHAQCRLFFQRDLTQTAFIENDANLWVRLQRHIFLLLPF